LPISKLHNGEEELKMKVRVNVIYAKAKLTQVSLIYLTRPTSFQ